MGNRRLDIPSTSYADPHAALDGDQGDADYVESFIFLPHRSFELIAAERLEHLDHLARDLRLLILAQWDEIGVREHEGRHHESMLRREIGETHDILASEVEFAAVRR